MEEDDRLAGWVAGLAGWLAKHVYNRTLVIVGLPSSSSMASRPAARPFAGGPFAWASSSEVETSFLSVMSVVPFRFFVDLLAAPAPTTLFLLLLLLLSFGLA